MKQVALYSDGACSGNPGPGGWGVLLQYGQITKELNGFETQTTNQRMELTAVIQGLAALKEPCEVTVYSDSTYVVHAFNQNWITNWLARNWVNSQGKPVANKDLWLLLIAQAQRHTVTWVWVKGHSSNLRNARADYLARKAILEQGGANG